MVPSGSYEVVASKETSCPGCGEEGVAVKEATGGRLATVISWEVVSVAPASSVTVRVTL
jgi:hypothetical protein